MAQETHEKLAEDAFERGQAFEREACAKWHDDEAAIHQSDIDRRGPIYAANMSLVQKIKEHQRCAAAIRAGLKE